MTIPTYLPYFVFTGTAATVFAILYGLNRALADAAWSVADRTRAFRVTAAVLLGWLALSIALAATGGYHVDARRHPHDPIRHRSAASDRQLADLAV